MYRMCRDAMSAGARRRRARDTSPTDVDNRLPALHSLGGGGREYKAVFVVGDVDLSRRSRTKAEVSQFSDEITANHAPLV